MMALSRLPYDNGMPNAVAGNLPFPQRYAGFICVLGVTVSVTTRLRVSIHRQVIRLVAGQKMLTHPCVGRVEIAFDGTLSYH